MVSDHGVLSYSEVASLARVGRGDTPVQVDPGLDLESIRAIYGAVGMGPMVINPPRGRLGVSLAKETMVLLSTSGTTGAPKLVPLSVGNWKAAVSASAQHLGHTKEDTWLLAMPLNHVGGLSILFRSSHVGARVRLLSDFEPRSFADALGEDVTLASMVPTMLRRVLDLDDRSYEGLNAVLVGGGPIPLGLLERAHERGIPALPTYGMTETCAQVATLAPGSDPAHHADLLPGVEARIESDGRIALRGEQVFAGYIGEERRLPDEWFITGDLGRLSGRRIEVLGRADDVIVTGGENVDPGIVEAAVRGHGGVTAAVVVGLPSVEWGWEVVCLYEGGVSEVDLASYVRPQLQGFEMPKRWMRVERVPITAMGKPDRARALEMAQSAVDGLSDDERS